MATAAEDRAIGSAVVSVVVASPGAHVRLGACLESLREQSAECAAELIVVRACDQREVGNLEERYPYARFVACPIGTTAPQLRAAGMRAARGDIVAVTEDHCIAAEGWLADLVSCYGRAAHDRQYEQYPREGLLT